MFPHPVRWSSLAPVLLCVAGCGAGSEPAAAVAPAAVAAASRPTAPTVPAEPVATPHEEAPRVETPAPAHAEPVQAAAPAKPPRTEPAAPVEAVKPAPPQREPGPSQREADAMSEAQLWQRRDLWPERVAFLEPARLDATTWWKPGDELLLNDWTGTNVVLDQGTFLFEWPAAKTDVVARTRALAASLAPEALALDVATLRSRPELWPLRLRVRVALRFANNAIVPAGREVTLRFFEGNDLSVHDREMADFYTVAPNETDLMARARERLSLPESERTPFFLRSLEAALDPDAGARTLGNPDYVLVYSGRLGCLRCADFAPRLEAFYAEAKDSAPEGARFELVFLSSDPDAASARQYVAKERLPGGVIAFERRLEAANLMAIPQRTLPGFFVFDRAGNLIERNHPDAGTPSASDVLAHFGERVAAARTAGR